MPERRREWAVTVKYTGVPFFKPVTVTLEVEPPEVVPSSMPSEARCVVTS